jgi:hypothetical protein
MYVSLLYNNVVLYANNGNWPVRDITECCVITQSGQTKDYKIGIYCFFAKHAVLRKKSKDWLVLNQDNVSEWSDMSTLQK